jgi:hypothetical protein
LRGQIYRDLRVRIDTGIHTGRMLEFMKQGLIPAGYFGDELLLALKAPGTSQ